MRLDQFLIATIVFMVIVVGGSLITANINDNYNKTLVDPSSDFSDLNARLNETYVTSQGMREDTLGGEGEAAEGEAWEGTVKGSYSAIKLIPQSFGLVIEVIQVIANKIGVPSIFVGAAITIISLMVIFAFIYLIFRFKA